jgi:arabinogalactan endo-1,4-beta-galactosidase
LDQEKTQNHCRFVYNLNDIATRYNKEVMVVEVGGEYDKVQNTYEMLAATIKAVKAVPNNKGLGVIYWETRVKKLEWLP